MEPTRQKLIEQAKRRFRSIHPCGSKATLEDCFTVQDENILFWFNTDDQTTHVLKSHELTEEKKL